MHKVGRQARIGCGLICPNWRSIAGEDSRRRWRSLYSTDFSGQPPRVFRETVYKCLRKHLGLLNKAGASLYEARSGRNMCASIGLGVAQVAAALLKCAVLVVVKPRRSFQDCGVGAS
jgi:hypothetical protein